LSGDIEASVEKIREPFVVIRTGRCELGRRGPGRPDQVVGRDAQLLCRAVQLRLRGLEVGAGGWELVEHEGEAV